MPRHSKKNSGNAIFTYNEIQYIRSLNKYGEIKTRIGIDFQKKFEQCLLCLNTMKNPVCCPKGHTYCKECLYKDLLFQKKKNKDIEKKEEEIKPSEEKILEQKKADFLSKIEDEKEIKEDEKEVPLVAKKIVEGDTTKCFWITQDMPTITKPEETKKKNVLYCPIKNHEIKLKEVITLNMQKNKANENKFICGICEKDLEIQKIVCLKECGHVMCQKCLLKICDKDKKCSLCGVTYSPSDIIKLTESGTGYSEHNKVLIKSNEPGFKC